MGIKVGGGSLSNLCSPASDHLVQCFSALARQVARLAHDAGLTMGVAYAITS